jgi:hypothetical protein
MRSSFVRRLFYGAIVIFWVAMMLLLVFRQHTPHLLTKAVSTGVIPQELLGEQWMGVYYKKEKIGYSCRNFEKTEKGYRISEVLRMNLKVMDSPKKLVTETIAMLDNNLVLTSFEVRFVSDTDMKIFGKVEGRDLHMKIETPSAKLEQKIVLEDSPVLDLSIVPTILREGLRSGKRFNMTMFDPSTFSRVRMSVEITGTEKISVMGESREVYRLQGNMFGSDFSLWLTAKGEILKEESPMGFSFEREKKEDALKIAASSSDLVKQASVPFNFSLPVDTLFLRIKIAGVDIGKLELQGGRQVLKGDILEVRREDLKKMTSCLKSESLNLEPEVPGYFLKDTTFIQSRDPSIVAMAKEIVKGETNRLRAAELIYDWVYKNIEKVPSISIPVSTEVLRTKKGDCNEHSVLFTALARAAGIPTKISLGLVYKDGSFYYHVWPEIFTAQWIAVDPTLGQFPADAAHIRLFTGDLDKQTQILSVLGKIKLEGLEYR